MNDLTTPKHDFKRIKRLKEMEDAAIDGGDFKEQAKVLRIEVGMKLYYDAEQNKMVWR